jgi:hypothetical protein
MDTQTLLSLVSRDGGEVLGDAALR